MIELQFLDTVPQWALDRGLNDDMFDLLEQVALHPENKDTILEHVEYGKACGILVALEYAKDKGLV